MRTMITEEYRHAHIDAMLDILIGWGAFWTSYYLFALMFDFKHKTTKYISTSDILSNVYWNMIWTGLFQPVLYFLVPRGIVDPNFVMYRFLVSVIITEFVFFYTHKLMHNKYLYRFHKPHHLFIEPCAFSAIYCHPIEAVLCNQLAITIGPIITGMGTYELMFWSSLTALNALKAHSGSRIPFFNSRYHDIHHSHHNVNYGFLYLLDIAHGTCKLPGKS